jgi:hypothetical protein
MNGCGVFFLQGDHFDPLAFFDGERELFGLEVFFHMSLARGSGQREHPKSFGVKSWAFDIGRHHAVGLGSSGQTLQLFFVYFDTVSRGHGRTRLAASHGDRTEGILLAETQKAGHLAALFRVPERAVKLHLGGGKNRRARASLADDDGKPLRPDDRGDFKPSLKSPDVREFDLQEIRRLRFDDRESVFRRADAFLSGDGDADGAAQFGKASEISPRQWLLGIGDMKSDELIQNKSRVGK